MKKYISLVLWILGLLLMGSLMGAVTKAELDTWYSSLQRSPLTPPDYVFGIAWTILYVLIALCGWMLWQQSASRKLKTVFIAQLLLNWSWTPLFFYYHQVGLALVGLLFMDLLVAVMIYLSYPRMKGVSFLSVPYLAWLLFATYLTFYIWRYNV